MEEQSKFRVQETSADADVEIPLQLLPAILAAIHAYLSILSAS